MKPVGEIVVVPVPPFIDRESFDAVQAMLQHSGSQAVTPKMSSESRRSCAWRRKRSAHSGTEVADGVGFEPTVRLHVRRFSRPLP